VKAFEVNAVDYLLKPFDRKRLTKTLDKVRGKLAAASVKEDGSSPADTASGRRAIAGRVAGAEAKLDALLRMVAGQKTGGGAALASPADAGALTRSGKVVVRAQNRLLLVDQKDVCFAAIDNGRILVSTKAFEGDSNCRTLEELMEQLDPMDFWRVHRSFIANIHHIREVVPWFKSSYQLRMDDRQQTELPVSRTQTRRLREMFNL
jgi:two-component system LytT family response regulator/two-component system response regulator LytT